MKGIKFRKRKDRAVNTVSNESILDGEHKLAIDFAANLAKGLGIDDVIGKMKSQYDDGKDYYYLTSVGYDALLSKLEKILEE